MTDGHPAIYAKGPITKDGTYYFDRVISSNMRQLLKTQFDPGLGKVIGTSSFVSRKGGTSRTPSFSRDGKWLGYTTTHSVVLQSQDSGEEKEFPMPPGMISVNSAVIFPDGRSVLANALTNNGEDGELFRVDVAGGTWTSLNRPGTPHAVGWPNGISPDGRTVYLNRDVAQATTLVARDVETGQERGLVRYKAIPTTFALSFDGKQLALAGADGKDLVVRILPAAGGPDREIYRAPGFQTADVTFTPDSRYVIIAPAPQAAAAKTYLRVSVENGDARPIGLSASEDEQVRFPTTFGTVRVHPAGRQLIYVGRGMNIKYEVWALENVLPTAVK
jgi:Tol biopolymer transport system component